MSILVTSKDSKLLFRTLFANGVFSLGSGLVMLIAAGKLAGFLGLANPLWLTVIGIGLIGFGVSLLLHVRRRRIRRAEAVLISALDLGWVLGSALLLLLAPGLFSSNGIVAVIIIAALVLAFFELQAFALWRSRSTVG